MRDTLLVIIIMGSTITAYLSVDKRGGWFIVIPCVIIAFFGIREATRD